MNPSKKIALLLRFLFLGLVLVSWSSDLWASYKVVLKDGRVLEARSKPVSMEGHYRFTDTNNQFQSISIQLVDLAATQSQNLREEPKSTPSRVLTNEDLTTGKQIDTQPREKSSPPLPNLTRKIPALLGPRRAKRIGEVGPSKFETKSKAQTSRSKLSMKRPKPARVTGSRLVSRPTIP